MREIPVRLTRSSNAPLCLLGSLALLAVACAQPKLSFDGPTADWPTYGGDLGGSRYSPLDQITPANVRHLEPAWIYHHGDAGSQGGASTAFENTPIVVSGTLVFCTPFNRVIALDPETGEERWSYDPEIDRSVGYANQYICRGVEYWKSGDSADVCAERIFTATNDSRLIALDAATGRPCQEFGNAGEVNLLDGIGELLWPGEYQITSPPIAVGGIVAVGSAVGDNARVDAPSGVIRAYDARTGQMAWAWDAAPPGWKVEPEDQEDGENGEAEDSTPVYTRGTPNAWAQLAADPELGLIYVPTGNASPDYWNATRGELNYYGSSVVALEIENGEVAWHYQTVHHDLWDFDVPAQPTLFTFERAGEPIPALVQATKMGFLFVLDRRTGEPLFRIEERPVPQTDVPGEYTHPTQPFPTSPPPLTPTEAGPEDAWGISPIDRSTCRKQLEQLRFDGMYTPPSLEGSLMYPGNAGGSNWGSVAYDPERRLLLANTMNLPWLAQLFPEEQLDQMRQRHPGAELSQQRGTPYFLRREMLLSPVGVPCVAPPWGELAAVDLERGEIRWQVPLGTTRDLMPFPFWLNFGMPNLGGPLPTRSGLVFIAAATDNYLRAFDTESGAELWKGRLPAGGQATPMTYRLRPDSRQYVVIAAGGHGRAGTKIGDALVAFALPD